MRVVKPMSKARRPSALPSDTERDAPSGATVRGLLRPVTTPIDPHPGQTSEQGATHDRPGSQPERVRHLYPNGNRPNSGSARSAQYKGKRRDR